MVPTHTISLRQPWPELLLSRDRHGPIKRVEFRPWPLPVKYVNKWLALHATAKPESDWIKGLRLWGLPWDPPPPLGAVCGIVRFAAPRDFCPDVLEFRYIQTGREDPLIHEPGYPHDLDGSWYAWPVLEIYRLQPIPCRGHQRIWRITDDVRRAIARQLRNSPTLPEPIDLAVAQQPALPLAVPA